MLQRQAFRLVLFSLTAATLAAAEYAVLTTGYRLRAERHQTIGDRVRLFTKDGGEVELPASAIVRFEQEDYVPPPKPQITRNEPSVFSRATLNELVAQLGEELQLHPALVHSVIEAESNYDPAAVSPKGAVGLMQLMPETASDLAVEDRRNPEQNVRGGVAYLKQLLERYAGSRDQILRALAAYNAGPGRVDRYDGLPPYDETRLFVRRVIRRFLQLTEAPPSE